ncbi:TRAP transporter large permease subunit [Limnobacter humi]|uniref:TRAP transporter large permease subunit n=1 Tax=Limnobacter humi TaxID=1778671 RepID=A0ABT1WGE0_9BURK|nr:TRAP transporter large permease subunit [Limnobacter humi]MCQ8895822.1 TRAP transporter large permease subunit [Limnobacter humi]
MQTSAGKKWIGRSPQEWLSSLPIFSLLLLTLIIGTGEMVHGQLLRLGERMFGDSEKQVQYFLLRADPEKPTCDPNPDIDTLVAKEVEKAKNAPASDLDSLFGPQEVNPDEIRQSLEAARSLCQERYAVYEKVSKAITPELKAFRSLETGFFGIFKFGTENRPLILLVMVAIAAVTTTMGYHHINLRPPRTRKDFQVYSVAMLIANLIMFVSTSYYLKLQMDSGVPVEHPAISWISIILFAGLSLISLRDVLKMPAHAEPGGSYGLGVLSIPLYAFMAINAGFNFFMDDYVAGLAIYFGQITELASIFLNLALYLWAGMLLKQTRVVQLFMDILRPWKLPPEVFTWIVLLAAAVPTAYTGASGVFVIAAGAIVYREVLGVGARRQFALAAAAMSGSLGVVLRPCLLIVVIAALNKEVTTSELYGWGLFVFIMTSTLFVIIALLKSEGRAIERAKAKDALPQSLRALVPVSPYIVIMLLVVFGYEYLLDTKLDEFTAPVMLPVIMLFVIIFDKLRGGPTKVGGDTPSEKKQNQGLEFAVRAATTETIGHIGALIMLMALSVSVGGMIERSGIMSLVPADMGSVWIALTLLMLLMIFIGMVMDPFGAVILVSATVAPVAYSNGIHPVHFWMIVVTAFELGYLSPPVALNQLLARQVVGEAEMDKADAESKHRPFYYKYERWLLPVYTMMTGLLIVVYGGQLMINNAEALKPVSHFLGLDQLRPKELGSEVPAAPAAPAAAPAAEAPALPADAAPVVTAAEPAAPAPEPVPAGPDLGALKAEVNETVSNWAAAWSARDVNGYLSFYSPKFEIPGALSRDQWEKQRRQRIASKKSIEVSLANLKIDVTADGNSATAVATFEQDYRSDNFKEVTQKTLRLSKEDGHWRITAEQAN